MAAGEIAIMSTIEHAGDTAHEEKEIGPVAPRSDEVTQFCELHAIESYLAKAEELATRLFPQVARIRVEFEEDSEDGDQYLVLEVLAKGDEDECFDAYKVI